MAQSGRDMRDVITIVQESNMAAANTPALNFWQEYELTCRICRDQFTRQKVLPCCQQSIACHLCLQEHARRNPAFPCPFCNQPVPLPPEGVSYLPDKYFENALNVFQTYGLPKLRTGPIRQLSDPFGIAVSWNGLTWRCFVADHDKQKIRVLLFNGASIRNLPTVVPGDDRQRIYPEDITIDGEGNLWVVGNKVRKSSPGFAVQYNTDGEVLRHFNLPKSRHFRGVAVDTERNHILVTNREGSITRNPTGAVHVYSPDGTLVNTVRPEQGMDYPQYITVDGEGRILVTDDDSYSVYVFNQDGQFLFQFGTGILQDPRGICTDNSENIIVADHGTGHVDMFDQSGGFLKSITDDMKGPQAVAIYTSRPPLEHLVVVDNVNNELAFRHV